MANMTEQQLCETLGLLTEPVQNRPPLDAKLKSEVRFLKDIFTALTHQKTLLGTLNPDIWVELLPWHSMN